MELKKKWIEKLNVLLSDRDELTSVIKTTPCFIRRFLVIWSFWFVFFCHSSERIFFSNCPLDRTTIKKKTTLKSVATSQWIRWLRMFYRVCQTDTVSFVLVVMVSLTLRMKSRRVYTLYEWINNSNFIWTNETVFISLRR